MKIVHQAEQEANLQLADTLYQTRLAQRLAPFSLYLGEPSTLLLVVSVGFVALSYFVGRIGEKANPTTTKKGE